MYETTDEAKDEATDEMTDEIVKSRYYGIPEEELNEYMCGICCDIFENPVFTKCCRQTYCSKCIISWLNFKHTCPYDRRALKKSDLSPVPRALSNLLDKLKIKCKYHLEGCEEFRNRKQLAEHHIYCDFNPKRKCKTCGLQTDSNVSHICIEELIVNNETIGDEIVRMRQELDVLKTNCGLLVMDNVIESARDDLNNYSVIRSTNGLSEQLIKHLVHRSKQSILHNNSYKNIARNICQDLMSSYGLPESGFWHSIVKPVGSPGASYYPRINTFGFNSSN